MKHRRILILLMLLLMFSGCSEKGIISRAYKLEEKTEATVKDTPTSVPSTKKETEKNQERTGEKKHPASGEISKVEDLNLGVYEATTGEVNGITVNISDVFEGGFTIELKAEGKATIASKDESGDFEWTLEGDKFHGGDGDTSLDGTLKDGVLVLEDVEGSGVTMTLVRK